jgi:bifunctional DNA-binding transcriptional regulator/antitoxin component of YhaV-PrlF toxin-antitoxin module
MPNNFSMTTTVTSKNMVTIPIEIARRFGVKPGYAFDWFDTGKPDEIAIRVIPDRKNLSCRLKGAGKSYSPKRDAVRELLQERSEELA